MKQESVKLIQLINSNYHFSRQSFTIVLGKSNFKILRILQELGVIHSYSINTTDVQNPRERVFKKNNNLENPQIPERFSITIHLLDLKTIYRLDSFKKSYKILKPYSRLIPMTYNTRRYRYKTVLELVRISRPDCIHVIQTLHGLLLSTEAIKRKIGGRIILSLYY